MMSSPSVLASQNALEEVMVLLHPLDQWLETALPAAEVTYGVEIGASDYRGLQINQAEVARLIRQEPGTSAFKLPSSGLQACSIQVLPHHTHLYWLQQTFDLTQFDLAILAIALAPELDRRYERLYAYLQDDVRCKRPTVDLCLNLLCDSAVEKLVHRQHFVSQAPLIQHGLLHLIADSHQPDPPLLAHYIKLDPQVIHLLLDIQGLDDRLMAWCQWITPQISFQELPVPPRIRQALPILVQAHWQTEEALKLYFQGADQAGKRRVAEAIADYLDVPLILANLAQLLQLKSDFASALKTLFREASFQKTLLYIEGLTTLQTPEHETHYQALIHQLNHYPGIVILAENGGSNRIQSQGMLTVNFPMPDVDQRYWYWQHYLQAANISLDSDEMRTLSDRLRLTADQIANAVITAQHQLHWQYAENAPEIDSDHAPLTIHMTDLFATAREISSQDLEGLCHQIQPRYQWNDLVLPIAQKSLLNEICDQIRYQNLVWKTWGFDRQCAIGKGLNVMFAGPPGTGKTMAAEVIAQELQLDLYRIDLSQIVSKYIGETEKNLNQIFTAATNANAILLFDEADALFGKRTEIKDAHDRYANLEISYLLQKMEEYEGLAILTTNLRANMDEAFVRRLQFIIEFPLPTEKQRYQIWQQVFPPTAPCSAELDFNFLASSFELSGANIRNISLAAAFMAAAANSPIHMTHITQAIRREYQKMGKILAMPTQA